MVRPANNSWQIGVRRLLAIPSLCLLLLASCVSQPGGSSVASTITIGINAPIQTLDPGILSSTPSQSIGALLFEPLYTLADDMTFQPRLATSIDHPNDLTWRFHLRDGVKFHDGQDFSADDVVYTINRDKDTSLTYIASTMRFFSDNVDRVQKVDRLTVDVITKVPDAFLQGDLAFLDIVPTSAAAAGANFGLKPNGTGPYRFVELVPGERAVLDVNKSYWGPQSPTQRIVVRPLVEDSTRMAALQAGEVQLVNTVPIDSVKTLKANQKLAVLAVPGNQTVGLVLRQRGPLLDRRVREAIAHAIDSKKLVDTVFEGTAAVATAPFSSNVYGYLPGLPQYSFDPKLSRKLLADAGYPNGIKLSFGIPLGNYLMEKPVGEAMAAMLQDAGIDVTGFEEVEWATFFPTAVTNKKYDIYFYGLGSADPSLLIFFQSLALYDDWAPPQRDVLMASIKAGPLDKAVAPLQALQKLMWDDLPWVFSYVEPSLMATDATVKGVTARPDQFLNLQNISWAGR